MGPLYSRADGGQASVCVMAQGDRAQTGTAEEVSSPVLWCWPETPDSAVEPALCAERGRGSGAGPGHHPRVCWVSKEPHP